MPRAPPLSNAPPGHGWATGPGWRGPGAGRGGSFYFGSKDSLLVHATFLGLLHDARRIERMGRQVPDAAAFRRNIARAVLAMPSLPSVARALAAGISKPELAPVVDQHLQLLFRQSERFVSQLIDSRG